MYKKILVPLDGSELSSSILDHVIAIATCCHVPDVILVRAREPLDPNVIATLDPHISADLDKSYEDEAAGYLDKIAKTLKKKGIDAKTEILYGNPAEEIIKYTQSHGVDLIIMSTHGRSGISRWVFGSVADKVLRNSTVPVLIKPAGRKAN